MDVQVIIEREHEVWFMTSQNMGSDKVNRSEHRYKTVDSRPNMVYIVKYLLVIMI
jgi:hypothetical protein